jgi:hypothetical protein
MSQLLRMLLTYVAISRYIVILLVLYLMYVDIFSAINYFKSPRPVDIVNNPLSESRPPLSSSERPNQFQVSMMGVHPDAELPVFRNVDAHGERLRNHTCLFKKGESLSFRLFISENFMFDPLTDQDTLVRCEYYHLIFAIT